MVNNANCDKSEKAMLLFYEQNNISSIKKCLLTNFSSL